MNNKQIIKLLTIVLVVSGIVPPVIAVISFYFGKIPEKWVWDTIGYGVCAILGAFFLNSLMEDES